tara:strand:+ start:8484 stop:9353 length:870 start_codon:yes stop_codon:yes gene_type:complete
MTNTKKLFENFRNFVKEDAAADFEKAGEKGLYDYTSFLKKVAKDPDFQKIARAGKTDGEPSDEVVTVDEGGVVPIASLYATQSEIGLLKSLEDQMVNRYGLTEIALGLKGTPIVMTDESGPVPLFVWNNKYILDGHHRWSQIMMTNPEADVKIDSMSGPALKSAEDALKMTQLAIAIVAQNVVTAPLTGANLMTMGTDEVMKFVAENITDEVLGLLVEAKKIPEPSKEVAAQYYGRNHKIIQKRRGKFEREKGMPQAGKSGGEGGQDKVNKALGTGAVNYSNPQKSDVK